MTKRFYIAVPALMLGVLLALAGCGGSGKSQDEQAAEMIERAAKAQGQEVDIEIDSGAFRATTEEGTFEISADGGTFQATTEEGTVEYNTGGGARLPEGFPGDVPVLEGLNILMSHGSSAGQEYSVVGQTSQSVVEVARYYKDALPGQGWTAGDTQQLNMGGMQMENQTYTKGERELTVNITRQDDITHVTLAVTGQ
jgi:hypothetical protein